MKRINVMVSDKAKDVIKLYQKEKSLTTLDETLDKFILEHSAFKGLIITE